VHLKQGRTLTEIDEMDILFYFRILRHEREKQEKEQLARVDEFGFI